MSTILKALQRLEQDRESARPPGPTPVFSRPYETRGGVTAYLVNPRIRRALVGVLVLTLGLAAVHVYRQFRPPVPGRENPGVALEKSAPVPRSRPMQSVSPSPLTQKGPDSRGFQVPDHAERFPADSGPRMPQASSRDSGVGQSTSAADLPPASMTRETEAPETPRRIPMDDDGQARNVIRPLPQSRTDGRPEADQSMPVEGNGENVTVSVEGGPEKKAASVPKTPDDDFKDAPVLTDGRLKVHAIAWSERADERMAVVNNRVMYEGDSMDLFTVVAIRPDDVVVREKEKGLWRVVFGRP